MSGERRPRPDTQVLASLTAAKRDRLEPDLAWHLATIGNVCDSYRSARGTRDVHLNAQPDLSSPPPNLRPSSGSKRCAGCRFIAGAGAGLARCSLYGVEVYSGVLWPHRTGERHEWQAAILGDDEAGNLGSKPEWLAAYADEPTTTSGHFDLLARSSDDDGPDIESGTVAA